MKPAVDKLLLSGKTANVMSDTFQQDHDLKNISGGHSPRSILLITIMGIAIAEILAMVVVYFFQYLPYYQQVLLDAAIMTVIIFPLLYFLSFRPLLQHIRQRDRVERIIQSRLRLMQFANTHTLNELLQFTLDEIESLTSGMIGYFHFLEADQKTLRLQALSTNTAKSMYPITVTDIHHIVDQAGTWADCIRQRQSVIHNDYASLPQRKGMPEGHAHVIREMAVPIVRDEKIVAILGIGNKPRNFTTSDVELVSTLADFAWDIVKQKQADKEIKERNQKEKMLSQTIHTMQLDIARDLHDTVGQNISFLLMKLDYLAGKKSVKKADMQTELKSMTKAANESYDLIRGTLAVLQSGDSADLFRIFSRFAEQVEERSAFKVDFSSQGEPKSLSAKRMRQLFYIFREALNNIEKHACATRVSIKIDWDGDCLVFIVADNGNGFDYSTIQYSSHFGIKFMRDRVEILNGSMEVQSSIGAGTNIIIKVPYE